MASAESSTPQLKLLEKYCSKESNKLGQGGFGAVFRGKDENLGDVAIKRILVSDSKDGYPLEAEIHRPLSHPNLLRLHYCLQTSHQRPFYR